MEFTIEPMHPEDWPSVRVIYEQGLDTGLATFETTAPDWEAWDSSHLACCRLVSRSFGQVIGWAALNPISKRKVYAGVAEVSIYITENAASQALHAACGFRLVGRRERIAQRDGVWHDTVLMERRRSN